MTKINRLSIHGFKSFAHKTDVLFDGKFNCILGPNGSGKSNVSDAICFVLGRLSAKSMRAEKAANLIFNGGKKKSPSDKGTVEIAFCNKANIFPKEDKEIVLSRTITKKGSSIYKINGKKHTRTEVLDLMATARINPEGYNIILQGDINRFVDMAHTERRKIIEGISDVSIYEEKKHKALLEMNKVEDKLNNSEIILKERKTYLRELKKDRDQALKFKDLKDKSDSNKATHLHLQITKHSKEKEQYDAQVGDYKKKIDDIAEKVTKIKEYTSANKEEIKKLNQEIEQKGEKQQIEVHRKLEDLKVKLAEDKARMSTLKDELTKIAQRKMQFDNELKEHDQKINDYSEQKQELQKQLSSKTEQQKEIDSKIVSFKQKHKLEDSEDLEKEIEDKDTLIEKKQEEIQQIRQEQQDLFREKDKIEYQLQTLQEKIAKVKEVEKENKGKIVELKNKKSEFKHMTNNLNQCLNEDSSLAAQIGNARKKLTDLQEQQAKVNARNLSVQEKLFHNRAVKAVLDQKLNGVHGVISQLGKVNKKYSCALENAAGSKTNFIVVDSDKVASDCIKYLKRNKLGSASFIPLNRIKYKEIHSDNKKLAKLPGAHGFALDLISFDSRYKKAFAYVFGDTLIVDNVDAARRIGIGKARMATLDGDLAECSGVMRGGFRQKTTTSFSEKDQEDKLKAIEASLGESMSLVSAIETKREANEQEISNLRNSRSEMEAEIITMEKVLHLDTADLDVSQGQNKELNQSLSEVDSKLSQIQKNIGGVNKELAEVKTARQLTKTKVSQIKNPRLLAQLSAFEESKSKFREDLAELKNEIKNVDDKVNTLIIPEKEKIQDILKQHHKEEEGFTKELGGLKETVVNKEQELKVKEKESVEFYSKYKGLFNQREKLSNELTHKEEEIEKLRDRSRTFEIETNKHSLKNAEVKARLSALNEEFKRFKDVPILKNKSSEELQKEITKFELMLSQMSAVNMKALEIYEQVEGEYMKLMDKKQSLYNEKGDIMMMMNEIETKKKDQFLKTFNVVNDNFKRIFSTLFRKGTAHLELNNPDDPFEDGLSIKVKLTGKRFMDIKSLSGGEKTLTALSFIFSIQEHQPASFYILDEIDAALDKHNSETLSKLIRSYSGNAQYLMISHNDSIISEADNLYGVSMNDHGISKVTSLKI